MAQLTKTNPLIFQSGVGLKKGPFTMHDRCKINNLFLPNSKERTLIKLDSKIFCGTFSKDGPTKCSGLTIKQYDEETLTHELENGFEKIKCITEDHTTPFNTKQNFLFCSFKRHDSIA